MSGCSTVSPLKSCACAYSFSMFFPWEMLLEMGVLFVLIQVPRDDVLFGLFLMGDFGGD